MTAEVIVERATTVDSDLVAAVGRLIPQLSQSAVAPSRSELEEIVSSPDSSLFLAVDGGEIVGMLSLVNYRIPTGLSAHVEDVVVDAAHSGRGIGRLLLDTAIEEARRRHARHVELTSRASREAANRLYQATGFTVRETNVYRLSLEP